MHQDPFKMKKLNVLWLLGGVVALMPVLWFSLYKFILNRDYNKVRAQIETRIMERHDAIYDYERNFRDNFRIEKLKKLILVPPMPNNLADDDYFTKLLKWYKEYGYDKRDTSKYDYKDQFSSYYDIYDIGSKKDIKKSAIKLNQKISK